MTMFLPTETLRNKRKDDPRYKIAEILMQPQTTQIRTPMEGFGGLAKTLAGAYMSKKLNKEYDKKENDANATLMGGLNAYGRSQQGGETQYKDTTVKWNKASPEDAQKNLINNLSMNPDTAPMAMQMQMDEVSQNRQLQQQMDQYNREKADKAAEFEKEAALKRELAAMRGGSTVETDPETGALVISPPAPQSYDPTPAAQAIGVPAKPLDTRGLVGKDQQIYTRNARTNAEKRLQSPDMTEAATKARNNLADSKRFEELMAQQGTGGLLAVPGAAYAASFVDPQVAEMRKITDRLTPQQRAPGSGATSDFDARMFQNSLFGVNAPKETNQAVIAAMQAKSQDELNFQSFLSDFLDANGHLNGADAAWQNYVSENPIFDPTSPNVPKINPARKTYQEFFGAQPATTQAPEQPAETPRQRLERLRAQKAGR
ncbi:hypothetical protein UFOVP353_57 [uncultured Caudovirales phage]|uniref:Uncharacterized protein n=1 Tax=uncultured Caudovirales phage TaxID=2100421 RepID=A0A6J5M0S0_9CAUD|nr:hypothetical protein UFOVP353_57 [uncultured Caudovirales phage]